MSTINESKQETTPPTLITLTLPTPEGGGIALERATATVLIQRGDLAYVMQFHYQGMLVDLTNAIREASEALGLVEANPPQVTVPTEPVHVQKAEKQAKPSQVKSKKKKKPSLDDFPTDDEDEPADEVESEAGVVAPTPPKPKPVPQSTTFKLEVGASVTLKADAVDVDGDEIDFTDGRICEIDTAAQPSRIWIESADGDYDVWVHAEALVQPEADDLCQFEQPVGMAVPDKDGQLTLFG